MCTVSWTGTPAGYLLFFNRDERRERAAALPPRHERGADGTRFLAPVDAEAGGTWLGVNEHGLTLGLLNHYAADASRAATPAREAAPPTSRGLLMRQLLVASELRALEQALAVALEQRRYRPFTLLAFAPSHGAAPRAFTWDGAGLHAKPAPTPPISSSSVETAGVLASRAAHFRQLGPHPEAPALEAYHRSHQPERGAFSVCMHRPDARTVSLSRIDVDAERVAIRYGAGPACQARLGPALTLARQARTGEA